MSSGTGVPLDPGPMDVEDSIPAPTPTLSAGGSSSSNNGGSRSIDRDGHNPEVAAGGGGAGGQSSGGMGGSSPPPPPPVAIAVGAAAGDRASAPEEKAEPSVAEVALVPLPPSFGEMVGTGRGGGARERGNLRGGVDAKWRHIYRHWSQ